MPQAVPTSVSHGAVNLAAQPSVWERIRSFLPEGHRLPDKDWDSRHKAILVIIWGHVIGLAIFGLVQGWGPYYSLGEAGLIGLIGLVAGWSKLGRRFRGGAAALALSTCSAVFTQFWGGFIEGHFHYFIIVAIVVLYQDWVPFILAVAYVAIDHGLIGTLAPQWVYNHPDALRYPWKWAAFHAALVLGECAALLYAWRMTEQTRSQVDLVMNAAGEAIIGLDDQGRIDFANPAATQITGRSVERLINQPIQAILQESKGNGSTPLLTFKDGDGFAVGHDKLMVRPDGSKLPVNWATRPILERGRTVGHVVTLMDATPQRRAEEERRQRVEQFQEVERLKELNSFKTLFINTAAHELHTPLTPLRLNVYALKEGHKGELNEEQLAVVGVLERNVERLSLLVEDVLNAARLQAQKLTIAKVPVDLARLTVEAVSTFEESARKGNMTLVVNAASNLVVEGDAQRLSQVLYNLIDNALKFTKPGGRIMVDARRNGDAAVVQVKDSGTGIPAIDLQKLFQPFSQAHDHMEYTRSGSGLGLYICKGIVDLHHGRITAESPGRGMGSTFTVVLPLAEALSKLAKANGPTRALREGSSAPSARAVEG